MVNFLQSVQQVVKKNAPDDKCFLSPSTPARALNDELHGPQTQTLRKGGTIPVLHRHALPPRIEALPATHAETAEAPVRLTEQGGGAAAAAAAASLSGAGLTALLGAMREAIIDEVRQEVRSSMASQLDALRQGMREELVSMRSALQVDAARSLAGSTLQPSGVQKKTRASEHENHSCLKLFLKPRAAR